ncbi:hypothetical protein, partial [Planktothrix agardhii]|uniref:hypothetical protein n=1 Tax=Planktothrix agardhii TaxID=1160 RepID=UPI001ED9BCB2
AFGFVGLLVRPWLVCRTFSPVFFSPLALYPSFFFSLLPFSRVSALKNFFFQGEPLVPWFYQGMLS